MQPDSTTKRVLTVSLEDQGVERPQQRDEQLASTFYVLSSSPYKLARVLPRHTAPVKRGDPNRGFVKDVKAWIADYKRRKGCCVCGEKEPRALHLHHADPTIKRFSISAAKGAMLHQVKEEVAKCEVLCANCHAKVHAGILVRK